MSSVASVYYSISYESVGFSLSVTPDSINGDAIAGQIVVFLVSVSDITSGQAAAGGNTALFARANNSAVYVQPEAISQGQIAEVEVIPDIAAVGSNVTVVISAERQGIIKSDMVNFTVVPGDDFLATHAIELRDTFVSWLQTSYPDLGITNETNWVGTIVSPRWLVVSHYLFFSRDWEMHVYWHIMIPPYDWARIDLRYRYNETVPAYSFEISSLNASLPPHAIEPPETLWR